MPIDISDLTPSEVQETIEILKVVRAESSSTVQPVIERIIQEVAVLEPILEGIPSKIYSEVSPEELFLEKTTDKYHIPYWQGNKIREVLQKIHMSAGYPVRLGEYIGFASSGLGLWLEEGFVIHKRITRENWYNLPSSDRWFKPYVKPGVKWREVFIYYIGLEEVGIITGAIPFNIDQTILKAITTNVSGKWIGIYENLGFYNTINDLLIKKNWDKVLKDLNNHGY